MKTTRKWKEQAASWIRCEQGVAFVLWHMRDAWRLEGFHEKRSVVRWEHEQKYPGETPFGWADETIAQWFGTEGSPPTETPGSSTSSASGPTAGSGAEAPEPSESSDFDS